MIKTKVIDFNWFMIERQIQMQKPIVLALHQLVQRIRHDQFHP